MTSADRTGDLLDGFGSGGFGLVNSDSQVKDARAGLRQRKKRLESLRLGGRGDGPKNVPRSGSSVRTWVSGRHFPVLRWRGQRKDGPAQFPERSPRSADFARATLYG
ncbi:MAG TPA: hypothetical protein VFX93_15575, partial [Xanthomonadaceae bacterium]|nr:hypothetical protein [Xanthomonadaceae bacterium]